LGNLCELLEVGRASRGQQSAGSFLRPWMARGELLAIAECAPEQLGALERHEPHLLGVFRQMAIAERSGEQTRVIMDRVFDNTAGKTPAETGSPRTALDRLSRLHARYATYSANPGRPLRS